jgi:hypothetical protein
VAASPARFLGTPGDQQEKSILGFHRRDNRRGVPNCRPTRRGFIWMPHEGSGAAVSQHASPERVRLTTRVREPCYRGRPNDQLDDAASHGATSAPNRWEKVEHTPWVSAPESVIDVVLEAVGSTVRANTMSATCELSAGFALLAP